MTDQQPLQFVRFEDAVRETGLSPSTIRARIKEGTFPPSRKIGARAAAFFRHELEEWKLARPIGGQQ